MHPLALCAYLALFFGAGFYVAYLYGRKTKQFRWIEYVSLVSAPVIGSLSLAYFYGIFIVYLFALSSVLGFVLEYMLGFVYHKTLNRRLWTYSRYSVGGYTSLLTFPFWGVGGIAFWLLAQNIGL